MIGALQTATTSPPADEAIRVFIMILAGPFIRVVCMDRVLPALKKSHPTQLINVPSVTKGAELGLNSSLAGSLLYWIQNFISSFCDSSYLYTFKMCFVWPLSQSILA
jgi:hypothetical protein